MLESLEGTTQGEPVAMALYALGLSLLLNDIAYTKPCLKQVAYADDLVGAGTTLDLIKRAVKDAL